MNKIFGIYFSKPGVLDYPLNKKVFFESYAEIIETIENDGIKCVIVRNSSYLGKGFFSHYFIWNGETYKKIDEKIKVDLLWNRDSDNKIPQIDDLEILNRFEFDEICRDKILTFEMLKEFSADTYLINSFIDLQKNIGKIKTDKVVLKPRFGEQCIGVHVLNKNEIKQDLYKNWEDILLQEFLDSSNGIEGLVEGFHEINIFIINGEFSGSRIKKPAEGCFVSSATGDNIGTVWGIKEKDIPNKLVEVVKNLDSKFSNFSLRLYRADFVYTTSGEYKLIELNSRPGIMHRDKEGKDFYWDFNGRLVNIILNYFNN